jgi:inositol 1,4,5-triphosphate receptor type 1
VSALIWSALLISLSFIITYPNKTGIRTFIASAIIRLIYSLGIEPTLWFIGSINVINKGIYLVSYMGNRGTFSNSFAKIFTDFEFLYHLGYLFLCLLGLCVHEFFYGLLVIIFKMITIRVKMKTYIFFKSSWMLYIERKLC